MKVTVPAPATGIVITRAVNPGQVVSAGQDLFVVTDLTSVWVIGDLYEKDFSQVRVGSNATISMPSAPDTVLRGRVAYIDPRVDAAARTAKVRVEVLNRNNELRLGMFVTATFQTGTAQRMMLVPRNAVQSVGERTVVYMPVEGEEGKFVERPVKLGPPVGDFIQVLEGLKPGDKVVTDGSFSLRAEATRTAIGRIADPERPMKLLKLIHLLGILTVGIPADLAFGKNPESADWEAELRVGVEAYHAGRFVEAERHLARALRFAEHAAPPDAATSVWDRPRSRRRATRLAASARVASPR